jgi:hypothetical protein
MSSSSSFVTLSLVYGLLFVLLSLPMVYDAVHRVVSFLSRGRLSTVYASGAPNLLGVLLHGAVFAGLVFGVLRVSTT